MQWVLLDEFVPNVLNGYDPTSVNMWGMKYGFILDNLYSMKIVQAETKYRRIELDYDSDDKWTAIRIYCPEEFKNHLKRYYNL